jgi:hypothetical protein
VDDVVDAMLSATLIIMLVELKIRQELIASMQQDNVNEHCVKSAVEQEGNKGPKGSLIRSKQM